MREIQQNTAYIYVVDTVQDTAQKKHTCTIHEFLEGFIMVNSAVVNNEYTLFLWKCVHLRELKVISEYKVEPNHQTHHVLRNEIKEVK